MLTTTLDAASILGITQRQVQNAIQAGLLDAVRLGKTFGVYEHQVFALDRMKLSGRNWTQKTWTAALDLLSGLETTALSGSQLSRLKSKLRTMSAEELVGHILAGRVQLYRADASQQKSIGSALAGVSGLTGRGTCVITTEDVEAAVRQYRINADPEGNVVAVRSLSKHRAVVEALAYIAYGSTREERVGRDWLTAQVERIFKQRNG